MVDSINCKADARRPAHYNDYADDAESSIGWIIPVAKKILTWRTVDPDNAEEMADFHLQMYRELLRDCLDEDPDLKAFEHMWEKRNGGANPREWLSATRFA
jgi:hypothetical protein